MLALLAAAPVVYGDSSTAIVTSEIEAQRAAFRTAYPLAERGDWQPARERQDLLDDYVLWPDLRAAWLRSRIDTANHDDIEAFLDEYGLLKPAREIRYRYALHLADTARLAEFHRIYEQYYQGLDIARLDCIALQAEIEAGRDDRVVTRALALWRVGHSQEDECDPVFAKLRDRGLLTEDEYRRRFALAIDERQFSLARYLARKLPAAYAAEAGDWLRASGDPETFVTRLEARTDAEVDRRQLAYAVRRIAYRDPANAARYWQAIRDRFSYAEADKLATDRHIALWAARLHLPEA
ncbi:MAG: hypothetical protein PVJ78_14655, partial [Gammaproteobacteria bacterium]